MTGGRFLTPLSSMRVKYVIFIIILLFLYDVGILVFFHSKRISQALSFFHSRFLKPLLLTFVETVTVYSEDVDTNCIEFNECEICLNKLGTTETLGEYHYIMPK